MVLPAGPYSGWMLISPSNSARLAASGLALAFAGSVVLLPALLPDPPQPWIITAAQIARNTATLDSYFGLMPPPLCQISVRPTCRFMETCFQKMPTSARFGEYWQAYRWNKAHAFARNAD